MATLPTASTPGYTLFRGRVTCVCLAKWLGVYERLLLARNLIKVSIDPWQLTGGAAASGGTHTKGGVFDLLYQTGAEHIAVAREMGAPATWSRTVSQGFSKAHSHGVLSGCPHNGPAAYQITAQRRGYNGLGVATSGQYAGQYGYGAKDNHPDPQTYRTWEQGVAWAESEIARLNPAPPPPPPAPAPPEDDMFSDSDRALLQDALNKADGTTLRNDLAALKADVAKTLTKADGATLRNDLAWQNTQAAKLAGQVSGLTVALTSLADGQGVDLDAVAAAAKAGAQAALDEKISGATTTLIAAPSD